MPGYHPPLGPLTYPILSVQNVDTSCRPSTENSGNTGVGCHFLLSGHKPRGVWRGVLACGVGQGQRVGKMPWGLRRALRVLEREVPRGPRLAALQGPPSPGGTGAQEPAVSRPLHARQAGVTQGPSGAKGVAGSQAQGALSPQESSARWQGALFTNKVCSWLHHPHSQAPLFHFNMLNYMESALAIKQN